MKMVLRVSLFIAGVALMIMSIGGEILRREPSTAYWMLGEIRHGDEIRFYLLSPDGNVQHHLHSGHISNFPQIFDWLPDGRSFLYYWKTDDGTHQLRRFSLASGKSSVLGQQDDILNQFEDQIGAIPTRNDVTIMLQQDRIAAFVVNDRSNTLRQLTPFHDLIRGSLLWSPDGEWLYYVARDGFDSPLILYRQHYDGSGHTELLGANDDENLYYVISASPEIAFVEVSDHSTFDDIGHARLYRLSTIDGTLSPLTPSDSHFQIHYRNTGHWFIVLESNAEGDITDLYRLSSDGEDFTHMLTISPTEPIGDLWPIPPNFLIFSTTHAGQLGLYRLNLETGAIETLIADGIFSDFREFHPMNDGQTLVFTEQTDNGMGHYRLNLHTGELQALMADQIASRSQNPSFDSHIMTTYQSYALVRQLEQVGSDNVRSWYRLNVDSGEYNLLYTDTSFGGGVERYPPTNGREMILIISRNDGTTKTLRMDILTGNLEWMSLGGRLTFAPINDKEWNMIKNLESGASMMIVSLVWSSLLFWRYGRSSCEHSYD